MSKRSEEKICVLCDKPASPAYRPFCSKRCADLDLHRWLTGAYVMPGEEDESAPLEDSDGQDGDFSGYRDKSLLH